MCVLCGGLIKKGAAAAAPAVRDTVLPAVTPRRSGKQRTPDRGGNRSCTGRQEKRKHCPAEEDRRRSDMAIAIVLIVIAAVITLVYKIKEKDGK